MKLSAGHLRMDGSLTLWVLRKAIEFDGSNEKDAVDGSQLWVEDWPGDGAIVHV